MANSPVATMTARVQIDKKETMDELIKDLNDVQKAANGKAIVYKLKADTNSLLKVLTEIQNSKFELGADIVIESKSDVLQKQINSMMKGLEAPISIDDAAINNVDEEIKTVTKDLSEAKKALNNLTKGSDLNAIKKQLSDVAKELNTGKLTEKAYDKKAKEFLDLIETYKQLGGKLSQSTVDLYEYLEDFYSKYKAKSLVADPAEIAKQEKLIEDLSGKLEELKAKKKDVADTPVVKQGPSPTDTVSSSTDNLQNEEAAFEKVGEAAKEAAQKKDVFTEANKQAAASAEKLVDASSKGLFEDSSGQLSFVENLTSAEQKLSAAMEKVSEEAKESSEQIEGQLSLDFSNATQGQEKYELAIANTNDELRRMADLAFHADTTNAIDAFANQMQVLKAQAAEEERLVIEAAQRTAEIQQQNAELEQQKELIRGAAETAFRMDTGQTGSNQYMQMLQASYRLIQQEVDELVRATQAQMEQVSLANRFGDAIVEFTDDLVKANVESSELSESLKEAIDITQKAEAGSSTDTLENLHAYEAELAAMYKEAESQRERVIKKTDAINEAIIDAENKRRKAAEAAAEKQQQAEKEEQQAAKETISSLAKKAEAYTNASTYVKEINDRAEALIQTFRELSKQDIINEDDIKNAHEELLKLQADASKDTGKPVNPQKLENALNQIDKYEKKYTGLSTKTKNALDEVRIAMEKAPNNAEYKELWRTFLRIQRTARDAGEEMQSMFTTVGNRIRDMDAKFIAQYLSIRDLIRYIQQAVDVIKELDYALIDLRKTTTMSADELNEFYFSANQTAKEMGVTTKEIIDQAAAWSRLGYSSKEAATEMAALSSQFAQISPGMSLDTATDGLVSTMKAFHTDVADVESEIMDVINKTGNTMATTNEEIVNMLERSSAAMAAANNSIKETIALESAAVQITRNAETTGTAFRTISMRIRGIDEETEELSEDLENISGKIADLTKSAKTPGGISLFTDSTKTTYKSTYQILKDIAAIYNDLSDKNQAELLETLAGKRGGQVLAGILQDFSEVERAMYNMENAAGSADAEMGIVEESINYKINALKETWVGVLQELIDNGMLGRIVDALTSISEVLGTIITTLGPIKTIVAGLGLRELLLHGSKLPGAIDSVADFIDYLSKIPEVNEGLSKTADLVIQIAKPIEGIGDAVEVAEDSIESLGDTSMESFAKMIDALGDDTFAPIYENTYGDFLHELAEEGAIMKDELVESFESVSEAADVAAEEVKRSWDETYAVLSEVNFSKVTEESWDDVLAREAQNGAIMKDTIVEATDSANDAIKEHGRILSEIADERKIFRDETVDAYKAASQAAEENVATMLENEAATFSLGTTTEITANEVAASAAEYAMLDDAVDVTTGEIVAFNLVNEATGEIAKETSVDLSAEELAFLNVGSASGVAASGEVAATGATTGLGASAKATTGALSRLGTSLLNLVKAHPVATALVAVAAAVTAVVVATKKANEELRRSAQELGKQFSENEGDIGNYKKKVEDLYVVINDETSSYEDSKKAREDLLGIQDELIEKYGKESKSIKDITDAINGQVDALDRLTDKQWAQAVNEFNEQNLKGWDWMNRLTHGASDNIGVMLKDMEEYSTILRFGSNTEFTKLVQSLYGGNLKYDSGRLVGLELTGTLDDVYDKILSIQQLARDEGLSDSFLSGLGKQASDAKELLDQYSQFYNQYVLNERVFGTEYEDTYSSLAEQYAKYKKAIIEDDKLAAEQYKQEMLDAYSELYSSMTEDGITTEELSVWKAFKDVVPEFQNELDSYVFTVYLQTDDEQVKKETEEIAEAIKQFGSAEEFLAYGAIDSEDNPLHEFYQKIEQYADAHKVTIEELIKLYAELKKLGDFDMRNPYESYSRFERVNGLQQYDERGVKLNNPNGVNAISQADYNAAIANLSDEDYEIYKNMSDEQLTQVYDNLEKIRKSTKGNISDTQAFEKAVGNVVTKIKDAKNEADKLNATFDKTKFVEMDDDLEKLQSLYEKFRGNVANGKIKVPLDISDVEALPETWKKLEGFKDFELKVTTSTNVDEVQKAFDDFATDYARNSIKIQGLTKETMDMVKAQMKMDGLEEGGVNKLVDSLAAEEKMNEFVDALEKGVDAEGDMEDSALDSAVAIYEEAKALGLSDDMLVDYLKEAALAGNIVIDGDEAWLYTLADALDMDIAKLRELLGLAQQGSGYATSYDSEGNKHVTSTYMPNGVNAKDWAAQQKQWRNEEKWRNVSLPPTSTTKSGGGSGSDEDPYIKQFEEELKKLDELRERGLITEKEYLNKQKELIDKFFKDREKYAEEYAKRLADYLKNMQTYYNSVISGVTTLIDHRISKLQDQKDSTIDALNEEKEAAIARYQAEIDAIDDAIKAKEEEKEALEDQIKAIEDANAARDRAISLAKAEYELQRTLNQRTRLVNIYARGYSNVA